jgi:hypothetical protein
MDISMIKSTSLKTWKVLKKLDAFAEPVHLNFGKKDRIPSSFGFILTLSAFIVGFIYFCNCMTHMVSYQSPNINYFKQENYFSFNDKLNLKENNI